MVTHEPTVAAFAAETVVIKDGRIVTEPSKTHTPALQ
jgi:ABC-type lipoprotein export system ATPase subunit